MTSARSVERGRWKFVSRWSTRWNSKPGVMKSSVRPTSGEHEASVSSTRTVVVPASDAQPPCRSRERLPHAVAELLDEQHLAPRALDRDARRDNARVVDDGQRLGRQSVRQIAEHEVLDRARRA